jgi:hypothetical protein
MQTIFHAAGERGYAAHGWLTTHHSFSFASYYDPEKMGFGALRVINDDTIAPGQGFGQHPHDNMEIITIPLSGALAHKDSMGNAAVIETGEVQVMSAGTGVEHSEFNASQIEAVSLLQIWILSKERNVSPQYAQKRFDQAQYANAFAQVVGVYGESELGIHQGASISLGRFDTEQDVEYVLTSPESGVYFLVIEGEVTIAGTVLRKRDALGVWDTDKVSLQAKKGAFVLAIEVPMF